MFRFDLKKNRYVIIGFVLIYMIVICFTNAMMGYASPNQKANEQVLPKLSKKSFVSIHDTWDFYWNQLLSPEDFRKSGLVIGQAVQMQVPGSWRGKMYEGTELPAVGFATYRTVVQIAPEQVDRSMALFLRYVDSASKIWIDGELVGEMGKVSTTAGDEVPKLQLNVLSFVPKSERVEIVIQVSNFSFREGGIVGNVLLGNERDVVEYVYEDELAKDLIFVGIFVILAFYHLTVYAVSRHDLAYLWIGMVSLTTGLRTTTLNEYLVGMVLPDLNWPVLIRAEYVLEMLVAGFFAMLIHAMYPNVASPRAWKLTWTVAASWIIFLMVGPIQVVTSALIWHGLITVMIFVYYIFVVGLKVVLRKEDGARLNLLGLLVMVIGIINEMGYYVLGWETVPIVGFCVLIYFVILAVIISYRHAKLSEKNRQLSMALSEVNQGLEQKVVERTAELDHKNHQLQVLHQQRSRLMLNIAHDLGSPLMGFQLHLQLMEEEAAAGDMRKTILKQLLAKLQYISRLVNDLFALSQLELKREVFRFESISPLELWDGIFAVLTEKEALDDLQVHIGRLETELASGQALVLADRDNVYRVVRNYADNAIKFSHEKPCRVDVRFYLEQDQVDSRASRLVFEIQDFGMGIDEADLPRVFERFYKANQHLKGTGLGLSIVKEIVTAHGGTVTVRSAAGEGSTFGFILPVRVD